MRPSFMLLLLLSSLLLSTSPQTIVDFTYSQLEQQQARRAHQPNTIVIKPDRQNIQGYNFPSACSLVRKLEEQKLEDSNQASNSDMDSMIDALKIDFIELLKVSQKIKRKKANIEDISSISYKYINVSIVSPSQINLLKRQQQYLINLDNQIKSTTWQLEQLVKNSPLNFENNQFALNLISFQIEYLKLKIEYLISLKKGVNGANGATTKDQYDKYFNQLKDQFSEQTAIIEGMQKAFGNNSRIREIKAEIQKLKTQIQIKNLFIQDKKECVRERDDIKRYQHRQEKQDQIKTLMITLRQRKLETKDLNNKYCEGVAAKLLDRVKKVLSTYDYQFSCAQGLDQLELQQKINLIRLVELESQLKDLQDKIGTDQYKNRLERIKASLKLKQSEMQRFKMPAYEHDPQQLDQLIKQAKSDLQDAIQRKKRIETPGSPTEIDYKKIKQLVSIIKKLKGTYCLEYEKYDVKSQEIWKQLQVYEAEYVYSTKMKEVREGQMRELRQLEALFTELRSKILDRIQQN